MALNSLLNALFPAKCLSCGKNTNGEPICQKCFSGIPINKTFFCGLCRARLANNKKICHEKFPYILGAASEYSNEAVKNLIHDLKFKYIKGAAAPLGKLLARYIETTGFQVKNFVVVPMPLSAKRLRERGFNQSELIAKNFAERVASPVEIGALARIKNSKPQSGAKNIGERRENVKACFSVVRPELVANKNILLIDDVVTSGATMLEAAQTLKAAGAKRIVALATAKA